MQSIMMFSLSQTITGSSRSYEIINPVNDDHLDIAAKIGPRIGRSIQGNSLHYVTGGMKDEGGNLWISSYYSQMQQLNSSLEIGYTPNVQYQAPANGDGIAYLQDMSLTTDGSKLLLAVSYGHHCVRVYDRETGNLVSTIGQANSRGNLADGKLWNPHSAIRLSDGSIVVTSYNGYGPTSPNHGSVSVWDVSTPVATLVSTAMEFGDGDGISAVGTNKLFRPMRMIWDTDNQHVWISEYGRGKILKVDTSTWLTVDVITAPTGVASIGNSYGLCQMSDGTLVVASNSQKRLVGINPDTKSVVFEINPTVYGSSDNAMRGLFELEPNILCWADWTTQKIYAVCVLDVTVQYETPTVPSGWEIDLRTWPDYLDSATFQATVEPHEIESKIVMQDVLLRKMT